MKINWKMMFLCATTAALMLPAAAQTATTNPATSTPVIKQRKINQQRRIGNGVKSGQLTPRETAHLEHREAHINRETRRMKAANGGTLTPAEKAKSHPPTESYLPCDLPPEARRPAPVSETEIRGPLETGAFSFAGHFYSI